MQIELDDSLQQIKAVGKQFQTEVQEKAHVVADIYVENAIQSLATPGAGPEGCGRRYVAIGIIGELGQERHIRYLEAAKDKPYESELNKREIDLAIDKIRERTQRKQKLAEDKTA